jgi:hypothetical protein
VLLSSLLLFQVELLSAKFILPWFGGSPAVWTISLLIFQLLLLGGYGYAHVLATRATMKTQTRGHLLVVGASLLLLDRLLRPGRCQVGSRAHAIVADSCPCCQLRAVAGPRSMCLSCPARHHQCHLPGRRTGRVALGSTAQFVPDFVHHLFWPIALVQPHPVSSVAWHCDHFGVYRPLHPFDCLSTAAKVAHPAGYTVRARTMSVRPTRKLANIAASKAEVPGSDMRNSRLPSMFLFLTRRKV